VPLPRSIARLVAKPIGSQLCAPAAVRPIADETERIRHHRTAERTLMPMGGCRPHYMGGDSARCLDGGMTDPL